MIHTKDLMLGNWVVCRVGGKDSDKRSIPMKVVALFDDCAYLNFDGNEGDVWEEYDKDLFGIDVTDELLMNMGFKKGIFKPNENAEWVTYDRLGFRVSCNMVLDDDGRGIASAEYLHQLQNAYHLLTGKHLEVKL